MSKRLMKRGSLNRGARHGGRWLLGVVGGALLGGWLVYSKHRPVIKRVPVVAPGGEIMLLGRGFGRRQGDSYLVMRVGDRRVKVRETVTWSDRRIVARLPDVKTSGSVQVVRQNPLAHWASAPFPFVVEAAGLPSEPYGYQVPVQADSPWPTFRRDHRNTGRTPLVAKYHGDEPWSFKTGKGVFSTPIIDGQGTIYVGSADHNFYAINPDGTEKWRFQTGEIIDSAGALPRIDPQNGTGTVIFPSGDGYLYLVKADDGALSWTFDARVAPRESYNNWFEGNVAIGHDGTLYAGNTNFNYYAISPDGDLQWTYETGGNNWSIAGFAEDGTIFWTSTDTKIRAVCPDGVEKWTKRTLGFLSASTAIGSDGTVYVGSFDSYFYALEPETGKVKWKFKTNDHIYGSAALGADADGNTIAIYFGSTDGILYALDPRGSLLWRYDTGAPIRSSPALGRAPEGEAGDVLYFGCGNGKLYALNATDGTRRWSFDTTSPGGALDSPDELELRDRNDLNGSPALGKTGVYIGGEHGRVWYVPYDYPLHVRDERGETDPGEDLPSDVAGVFYVTPGGNTELEGTPTLSPATFITLRLVVREGGETINAWVYNAPFGRPKDALDIRVEPKFPFRVEQSADGRYIHIIPTGFLEPGRQYRVRVEGDYYTGGLNIGNLTLGGRKSGRFEDTFAFRTEEFSVPQIPLAMGEQEVSALEWTRLAVPIPTMLPSLNQVGFDYMDWILGTVALTEPDEQHRGKLILWAVGGRRDDDGTPVVDPRSDFTLPLSGTYQGDAFILTNKSFKLAVTGIPIPFNLFQVRGQLGADLRVGPGATAYADAKVLSVPTFGPLMVIAGLANNWWEKLFATGTYVTRPYDRAGLANVRPEGISVATLDYCAPTRSQDGKLVATLRLEPGMVYPLDAHRPGILLVDAARTEAVCLDYHANLAGSADETGNLSQVSLTIPAGTELPQALKAIVILDVFPLHEQALT